MKTKLRLLAVALIAGGTMFAQSRLSVGVSVGGYGPGAYPPPAYGQYRPLYPGPGYSWVDGYWAFNRGHRSWTAGFWQAPRFVQRYSYSAYRDYRRDDRGRDQDRDRGRNWRDDRRDDRGNGYRR